MQTGRHTAVALEMRGVLASFDRQERTLTVRVSTQAPQMLQTLYARDSACRRTRCGCSPSTSGRLRHEGLRLSGRDGGGDGGDAARPPLKWTQDRYEALQSDTQARDERVTASLALAADGRILGLRSDVVSDAGAWSMYPAAA